MIPLRTPAPLKVFPLGLFGVLVGWIVLSLIFGRFISSSDQAWVQVAFSFILFPSIPLALLCGWYLWIFFPSYLTRPSKKEWGPVVIFASALAVTAAFRHLGVYAAGSFVLTLLILGGVMWDQIWDNVDTLVVGPKLFSVYEVPCYVHTFFFLFYIFLAQLVQPAYGMVGNYIYLVSLFGFIVGFLIRAGEVNA